MIETTLRKKLDRDLKERSIRSLALDAKIGYVTLWRVVNNERQMGLDTAERLARYYKLRLRA